MAKILIVDDDKDILRLLEFTFKRAKHEVIACLDGPQALAEVKAQKPDLIVADVMMPRMTGYEFCERVRAEADSKQTPIIIFSARFQPIDRQTALDAGATDYLPKSSSPDVLVKSITEYLPSPEVSVASAIIGFFSLRGGIGVTSLAVNSAIALASTQKARTVLVDLVPLGGHAALMLGLRPTSNVGNALSASKNDFALDSIRPHLMKHSSGIQLLASTLNYEQKLSSRDERLEQLIVALKSDFPLIVLDVPHILESHLAPILKLFDKISLILSPDMPSLQSTAMALLGLARLGISEDKIMLVLNQIGPQSALSLETIQKAVRRPIAANIPFEPDMIRAVNNGKPLLISRPESVAAVAISQLANKLLN